MKLYRAISTPIRSHLTFEQRWRGPDNGLITCWETGRLIAAQKPELAAACARGELPVLAWKGGVPAGSKARKRRGTLRYLATWQGLAGQPLNIETEHAIAMTCTRTGVTVTYSGERI